MVNISRSPFYVKNRQKVLNLWFFIFFLTNKIFWNLYRVMCKNELFYRIIRCEKFHRNRWTSRGPHSMSKIGKKVLIFIFFYFFLFVIKLTKLCTFNFYTPHVRIFSDKILLFPSTGQFHIAHDMWEVVLQIKRTLLSWDRSLNLTWLCSIKLLSIF